jgi:hypothetical protein
MGSSLAGIQLSPAAPPPEAHAQSFSVASGSILLETGVHPADVLGLMGNSLIACAELGLICSDPFTTAQDQLGGLSFGQEFSRPSSIGMQFSVAAGSQGLAGTAVRLEAGCPFAEPQADAFHTDLDGTNAQFLDGDGSPCAMNDGLSLYLTEGRATDDIAALEGDPCELVDIGCDGIPDEPVYFSLKPGSPSLDWLGAQPGDILVSSGNMLPNLWASASELGLASDDVIDALCLREDGDLAFTLADRVLFSLAPGSPTLATIGASPADVLRPSAARIAYRATALGLEAADDVDALWCPGTIGPFDVHLPILSR